jgi:hypothetical protein
MVQDGHAHPVGRIAGHGRVGDLPCGRAIQVGAERERDVFQQQRLRGQVRLPNPSLDQRVHLRAAWNGQKGASPAAGWRNPPRFKGGWGACLSRHRSRASRAHRQRGHQAKPPRGRLRRAWQPRRRPLPKAVGRQRTARVVGALSGAFMPPTLAGRGGFVWHGSRSGRGVRRDQS